MHVLLLNVFVCTISMHTVLVGCSVSYECVPGWGAGETKAVSSTVLTGSVISAGPSIVTSRTLTGEDKWRLMLIKERRRKRKKGGYWEASKKKKKWVSQTSETTLALSNTVKCTEHIHLKCSQWRIAVPGSTGTVWGVVLGAVSRFWVGADVLVWLSWTKSALKFCDKAVGSVLVEEMLGRCSTTYMGRRVKKQ